jgi:hypothetical protein
VTDGDALFLPCRSHLLTLVVRFWLVGQTLEFKVGMTCGGCKTAVSNIMSKTPGVTSVCA